MDEQNFKMRTVQSGRIRYFLLTLIPPLAGTYLITLLMEIGIIPRFRLLVSLLTFLPIFGIMITGYFFVFNKNHVLRIDGEYIERINWHGKSTTYNINQIHSYRKNLIGETVLLDEDGKKLFAIETNMTNQDIFMAWLDKNDIEYQRRRL